MATINLVQGKFESYLDTGALNNGGTVGIYEPDGTYSTLKTHYTSSSLATPNSNPLTLDSAGRGTIYYTGDADIRVRDSLGNIIYSQRNVSPQTVVSVVALTGNTTIGASHYSQFIQVSGAGVTLTLSDAGTLTSGWYTDIVNTDSTNTVTIGRATGGDTINGTAANISLLPYQAISVFVNAAANGFIVTAKRTHSKTNTVAEPYVFNGDVTFTEGLGPSYSKNYSLQATVGSNALTITLSDYAGNALSSTNKARFTFRNATAVTGTSTVVDATANLTLVISSGSTLGTTSAVPARFWIVIFNDAGTLRLGAINCSTSTNIYPLSDDNLASSTAEGGAGAADSAGVIYTGTTVTTKAMRVIGYVEHTQATAGTYATTPSKVQLWQSGMKLPGDVVQQVRVTLTTLVSGTTVFPADNTIPQNTEGFSILDATPITPTSTSNFIRVHAETFCGAADVTVVSLALFRDSVADAIAAHCVGHVSSTNYIINGKIGCLFKAPSTSAITYKLRGGSATGATAYFNSGTATVLFGGVAATYIQVEELMG